LNAPTQPATAAPESEERGTSQLSQQQAISSRVPYTRELPPQPSFLHNLGARSSAAESNSRNLLSNTCDGRNSITVELHPLAIDSNYSMQTEENSAGGIALSSQRRRSLGMLFQPMSAIDSTGSFEFTKVSMPQGGGARAWPGNA
jgi:hypothetical protein